MQKSRRKKLVYNYKSFIEGLTVCIEFMSLTIGDHEKRNSPWHVIFSIATIYHIRSMETLNDTTLLRCPPIIFDCFFNFV